MRALNTLTSITFKMILMMIMRLVIAYLKNLLSKLGVNLDHLKMTRIKEKIHPHHTSV